MVSPCHNHGALETFRSMGGRLRNWGRWGDTDRIGTLNYITSERLVAAAATIKRGKIYDLGLSVGSQGIQAPGGARINPVHLMSVTPLDYRGREDGLIVSDDYIFMALQAATHWDGLGHVGYDDAFYNNVAKDSITSMGGSAILSIDQIAKKGVAGRGVLLDIAALRGVEMIGMEKPIHGEELEAAEARQGVKVGPGDILIIRTGWIRHFTVDRNPATYWKVNPGLHYSATEFLYEREVAALAADTWCIEMIESLADFTLPFHSIAIRDMGMTLGENFYLEALAADCLADEVWEFFFSAPPIKVEGGVGSPVTPIAIK